MSLLCLPSVDTQPWQAWSLLPPLDLSTPLTTWAPWPSKLLVAFPLLVSHFLSHFGIQGPRAGLCPVPLRHWEEGSSFSTLLHPHPSPSVLNAYLFYCRSPSLGQGLPISNSESSVDTQALSCLLHLAYSGWIPGPGSLRLITGEGREERVRGLCGTDLVCWAKLPFDVPDSAAKARAIPGYSVA